VLTLCRLFAYIRNVIRSFKNRALAELWSRKQTRGIDGRFHGRILRRLDVLDMAQKPEDMNLPGFNFHALKGGNPTRYTVHVNGPWCITFEFEKEDAVRVDFEQYH
jgi:toxin HigB-1